MLDMFINFNFVKLTYKLFILKSSGKYKFDYTGPKIGLRFKERKFLRLKILNVIFDFNKCNRYTLCEV